MYLMIDHYDSFVYNLASYFRELGAGVEVVRSDDVDAPSVLARYRRGGLRGIVISPGPKRPEDSAASAEIVAMMERRVPILGVCLGHQIISCRYGAAVRRGDRPMHGKISLIRHNRGPLFEGMPDTFRVTRYHSLVVDETTLPGCLSVDARAEDGAVMAIRHRQYPVFGIQFHPEAVLTEYGHSLIGNFISLCERRSR
ncbi:MAG: anthranilate synthase component II [Bacillota bacterium]